MEQKLWGNTQIVIGVVKQGERTLAQDWLNISMCTAVKYNKILLNSWVNSTCFGLTDSHQTSE